MKHPKEVSKYMDNSLAFIKHCRKAQGGTITFNEVKSSVEKTYARNLTVGMFRQLLSVVPDLYEHSW